MADAFLGELFLLREALVILLGDGLVVHLIVIPDAEVHLDDGLLTGSQAGEESGNLVRQTVLVHLVHEVVGVGSTHRHLSAVQHGGAVLGGEVNPLHLDVHDCGDISDHLAHLFQDVHQFILGDVPVVHLEEVLTDLAGLVGQLHVGGVDRLPLVEEVHDLALHPPAGVGGEAVTQVEVELVNGDKDTIVGLLDEILEKVRVVGVGLGNHHSQLGQLVEDGGAGGVVAAGDPGEQDDFLIPGQGGMLADFLEVEVDVVGENGVSHVYLVL